MAAQVRGFLLERFASRNKNKRALILDISLISLTLGLTARIQSLRRVFARNRILPGPETRSASVLSTREPL